MPTFKPPTVAEGPAGMGPLFGRMKLDRGETVLKESGVYSTVRYPTVDRVNAAEEVYLGGHTYLIDQATADALTAAGYGANIT